MKERFTGEQLIGLLHKGDSGVPTKERVRRYRFSAAIRNSSA